MKLKELLKDKLTQEEINIVPSSFDVVGSILIFSEFPKKLTKKEKIIAQTILDNLKNIKTVCKKTGKYSGKYRTPKLKVILGEKTKETIHKENGILLKLNVEEVYFSTRSSTERLRVAQQVKQDEEVLVMFSGCAPYPCVIAKNSKAKFVYGVEINPVAHKYALENIRLNRLSNVFVVNHDVNKAVPQFYQEMIGLKSAVAGNEMRTRMKFNPSIIEIHTFDSDFKENYPQLRGFIKKSIEKGKNVVLHQPFEEQPPLDLVNYNISDPIYQKMLDLSKEFDISLIIHINGEDLDHYDTQKIINNIIQFKKYYKTCYFENSTRGYTSRLEHILEIIKSAKIENFCIDTCHLLHSYSPDEMIDVVKEIQKHCNTYFHISDYKNKIHGGKLDNNSSIKLKELLPLVTKGITEVKGKDEKKGTDMISSWKYLKNFTKQFDRVLMPLPRSSEKFLKTAIPAVKRGGILHFYQITAEKDFEKSKRLLISECKKQKRKCKILNLVKCGHFGPGIYRICIDAKIL